MGRTADLVELIYLGHRIGYDPPVLDLFEEASCEPRGPEDLEVQRCRIRSVVTCLPYWRVLEEFTVI